MNISRCLGINVKAVKKTWKEMDVSNDDYECRTARKINPYRSLWKRPPEFLDEVYN